MSNRLRSKRTGGGVIRRPKQRILARGQRTRGLFYLFVAYDVKAGRRRWAFYEHKRSEQTCRFMQQI